MTVAHCLEGLRPIRRMRKITPSELADLIGLQTTSYSRFERGERRMYADQLKTLAKRLGVRTDDLFEPLTEDAAASLCNARDAAAIAAGTFDKRLWAPGSKQDAEPQAVPPPPPNAAPPPPPQVGQLPDALEGWNV